DGLGGADIGAHIRILTFRANQRLVQGIEHDDRRLCVAKLAGDVSDEEPVLHDKVRLPRHDEEWNTLLVLYAVVTPERLYPLLIAVGALERAVDDQALPDRSVAILPAHCDVEHQVEHPK